MLRKIVPHVAIIISGMYLVFFLIDRVNSAMAFINNNITKRLILVLCVISVIEAAYIMREDRQKIRQQEARAAGARRRREEQRAMRDEYNRYIR